MFLLNGQPLQEGTSFTDANGTKYPPHWLNVSTEEEKAAIGITWVADPIRADERFYWSGDINNPKDLDGLKKQFVAQIKDTAGKLLSQTDWQVIRKVERYIDIEPGVVEKRAHVVNEANRLEAAINNSPTVEGLIEVLNNQKWEM
jgi:hypothetical protein